ncbi:unnamed protein product [Blepharisma stoltei]|uniref:Serine/threonine-protein kinase PLK n=1 Tax=Blepharisma stoltei TaxID=1481888 RepID=A0AAU9ITA6_9CILI|nr:unnamed protein product [Blepharisma stoltei]
MALSSRSSARKSTSKDSVNNEGIIEEQIVKPSGEVTIRRYSKGKFLGKGGFARVYEFTSLETRKVYAGKVVVKASLTKSRAKQKLMSEIKIHRSLRHANIVGFEHFFEDNENVYILLELCPNQTMSELLRRRKRLTELEVQCYSIQIISALKYLHQKKVIHRDLKIGNLFISEKMELKLGDFGLASKLEYDGQMRKTICGTPNYIAPEILDGKEGHSYEVDIWSFGVILFTLLIGKPPFETNDVKKTYNLIKMNAYSFPDTVRISEQARSLITRILRTEPSRRPSLDEILEHDFFHMGHSIPQFLPISTLAVPPSDKYIKQFLPSSMGTQQQPTIDTAPLRISRNTLTATSPRDMAASLRPKTHGTRTSIENTQRTLSPKVTEVASIKAKNEPTTQNIWVKKWVDYSSKYGLGYVLSNGCAGVYFNDSCKIIIEPNATQFYYVERTTDRRDITFSYSLDNYPKSLHKKVALLQHFKNYLEAEGDAPVAQELHFSNENPPPYVKKWMRTKRAILFRLSNKIVQVSFQDQTEVILSSEEKVVTYVNKRAERVTIPLAEALESTHGEMAKRLKYTRDILNYMMNGQVTGGTGSPS